MRIPPEIAVFLTADNVVAVVASASLAGRPTSSAAALTRVEDDGAVLSVGVSERLNPLFVRFLRENPLVSVSFTSAPDCRSYQVKGRVLALDAPTPADHAELAARTERMMRILWRYNPVARERGAAFHLELSHVLRLAPLALFEQSPGPAAGAPVTA